MSRTIIAALMDHKSQQLTTLGTNTIHLVQHLPTIR